MQLNSRGARDPTQLHWTLARPVAALVNCSHVILNIIPSLEPPTTLWTLEVKSSPSSISFTVFNTYCVALLFGMCAQMPAQLRRTRKLPRTLVIRTLNKRTYVKP